MMYMMYDDRCLSCNTDLCTTDLCTYVKVRYEKYEVGKILAREFSKRSDIVESLFLCKQNLSLTLKITLMHCHVDALFPQCITLDTAGRNHFCSKVVPI